MFLGWYKDAGAASDIAEQVRQAAEVLNPGSAPAAGDTTASGWDALGWFETLVLMVAVVTAVGFAFVTYTGISLSLPIALSATTAGAGIFAFLFVLHRVINPPGDGEVEREVGLWLGLLASAGVIAGGYLGMQEEEAR
jgi:hypothetical protein